MAEQTNKRKAVTSAIALATAAALLLGGTLAWQSISQEATNIVSAAVNPGGRLHDDFDGSNDKNVYVENFGTQNIYARIKLSEYLEIGQNAGIFTEGTNRDDVDVLLGTNVDDKTTYETYLYGGDNISDRYWTKDWEGGTKYIPTFNKDQDSLEADLNGTYENTADADGDGTAEPYEDFVDYNTATDYSETAYEWFDADTNDTHEAHDNPTSIDAGNHNISETEVEHTLADSIEGTVISMADWDGTAGNYWVYDADGWAYWANPIAPGTATGLLLDSITDLGYIDEDYYYAIHVTGQFITAGDLGDTDNTGFYQNEGEEPSAEALELLKTIGVKVDGIVENEMQELELDAENSNEVNAAIDEGIKITTEDETADLSSVKVWYWESEAEGEATEVYLTEDQYTYADGILTITDASLAETTVLLNVTDASSVVFGSIQLDYHHDIENADYIEIGYIPSGQPGLENATNTVYASEGYMKPGDYMTLMVAASIDGEINNNIIVSDEDVWTVTGATSASTTVDENGKLTIGTDESTALHLITVKVEYRGLEATEHYYVSGGLVASITEMNNAESYTTNTNYQFKVSVVENETDVTDQFTNWDWSVTEKADDGYAYSTSNAEIDENGNFKATAAGTYFIYASADYYFGPKLEIEVKELVPVLYRGSQPIENGATVTAITYSQETFWVENVESVTWKIDGYATLTPDATDPTKATVTGLDFAGDRNTLTATCDDRTVFTITIVVESA